ncbi:MAG TPA: DNA repair exonuclease [Candidatus Krumholzibacteriaceae bacterium]|nr:DNA repair exonuclease [Candidatus Krumholzibacteriaceae bacterium]
MKAVITGDNHLNLYNQRLGSRLSERRRRLGQAWRETVDYAIDHEADLYINTGDLFDQISPRNPPRASVVEAFRELKDAGVESFIIAGNHEAPGSIRDGASPHTVIREAGLATVFENRKDFGHRILDVRGTRVSIAGMSYDRNLPAGEDPLADKTVPAGGDVNIALLHYSVERIAPPIWEEPVIKVESLQRNSHIHLYVMGHIHAHIDTRVGDSRILYPGATEHYNFGECGKQTGFCYAELAPGEIQVEFIQTEAQPMSQVKLHTSTMDPDDPTETILQEINAASNHDGLLQLVLEGETAFEHYTMIDFPLVFDRGGRQNFYFEYVDHIRPVVQGVEFTPTEGLNPRRELEAVAKKFREGAAEREQDLWSKAAEYALSYYEKHRGE